MKHETTIALTLLFGLGAAPAPAQMGGMPSGDMSSMTPEQAAAMAEQMMLRFGGKMGLDPEALRNASPEEREEMLQGGADAMAGQVMQRMERMFGMSAEEMQNLGPAEKAALRARMTARFQQQAVAQPAAPRPLYPAPRHGFPDGSVPLPVAPDYSADLVVAEPADRELLLVVADVAARKIVWRETRIAPFEEHLDLLDIAPNPGVLMVELIDPDTHRVIRRYRPVAAVTD